MTGWRAERLQDAGPVLHGERVVGLQAAFRQGPRLPRIQGIHPGVELRANLSQSPTDEVAFVWELTKETIQLPLVCLQGGQWDKY